MTNDALEFIDQFLTEDEKAESDFRVALVGEFIHDGIQYKCMCPFCKKMAYIP